VWLGFFVLRPPATSLAGSRWTSGLQGLSFFHRALTKSRFLPPKQGWDLYKFDTRGFTSKPPQSAFFYAAVFQAHPRHIRRPSSRSPFEGHGKRLQSRRPQKCFFGAASSLPSPPRKPRCDFFAPMFWPTGECNLPRVRLRLSDRFFFFVRQGPD